MHHMREMAIGGVIALASLLLAGSPAYAAPSCSSLVTPAQAAAALGVPEVKGGNGTGVCEWVPSKSAPGQSKTLEISVSGAKRYEAYASLPSMPGRFEITPVSGIGDGAMQHTMQGARTVLIVKKAANSISVAVTGLPLDQAKAAEQTLARQILQKL